MAQVDRTFSLPAEQASYIDQLVKGGTYRSPDEVVDAGLSALRERETLVDKWLRDDVAPVYDAMVADPERGISADDVTNALKLRHDSHLKAPRAD